MGGCFRRLPASYEPPGCLHVFFFFDGSMFHLEYVTLVKRFHTVESKWEEIVDKKQARVPAFSVTTNRKVFVAGALV